MGFLYNDGSYLAGDQRSPPGVQKQRNTPIRNKPNPPNSFCKINESSQSTRGIAGTNMVMTRLRPANISRTECIPRYSRLIQTIVHQSTAPITPNSIGY